MVNFEFEAGIARSTDCKLCDVDSGNSPVYSLIKPENEGLTPKHRVILGLSKNPLILNRAHSESGRSELLKLTDIIAETVAEVYRRRGATDVELSMNYRDLAGIAAHPHAHLTPKIGKGREAFELPIEQRGNEIELVGELTEGIEKVLSA